MSTILTFQAAVEKMTENPNNGDVCRKENTDAGFIVDDNCHIMNAKTTTEFYRFESADFYGKKWQIIPAKKEPVSFDKWLSDYRSNVHWQDCGPFVNMSDTWKASAENQNLLYADLMQVLKEHDNHDIFDFSEKLAVAIDKITAALKSD